MAASIDQFINEVTDIYDNHGIYLWGGNGELTKSLTIYKIINDETGLTNASRVLSHISQLLKEGHDLTKSKAVDCSGLVVAALRKCGAIGPSSDYRACDLQKMCKSVKLKKLKKGDLVFNKSSEATHVGVYDGEKVIEAQGRDVGVTRRDLSKGNWIIGGRLPTSILI